MFFSLNVFRKSKSNTETRLKKTTKLESNAREVRLSNKYSGETEYFAKCLNIQRQMSFVLFQKFVNAAQHGSILAIASQSFTKSFVVIVNLKTFKPIKTFTFTRKIISKLLIIKEHSKLCFLAAFVDGDLRKFYLSRDEKGVITEKLCSQKILDMVYVAEDHSIVCCGEFNGLMIADYRTLKLREWVFDSLKGTFNQLTLARGDTMLLAKEQDGKVWAIDLKGRCMSGKFSGSDQWGFKIVDMGIDDGVAINYVTSTTVNIWKLRYNEGGFVSSIRMEEVEGSSRGAVYWRKYDLIGIRNNDSDGLLLYDLKNQTLITELQSKHGNIFKVFWRLHGDFLAAFDEERRKLYLFNVNKQYAPHLTKPS